MNIVHLLEKLDIEKGGLGQFFWYIAKWQAKKGHTVSIFYLTGEKNTEKYVKENVTFIPVARPHLVRIFGGLRLFQAIKEHNIKPDIIHGPQSIPFGWFFPLLKKINSVPVAVSAHSAMSLKDKFVNEGIKNMMETFEFVVLMKMILKYSDVILPVANFIKKELIDISFLSKKKIYTVPPGVDLDLFKPRKKIPSKSFVVFFIGRFIKRKGIIILLQAAKLLKNIDKNIKIKLIGGRAGDEGYKEVISYIKKYHLEKIIETITSVPYSLINKEYQKADACILPSFFEPFARTNLEAMASGVPVIASRSGGVSDLIKDKENGLLFPPKNAKKLAEAILTLKNDQKLYKKIVKNALETVKEYDWKLISQRYTDIFKKTIREYKN